MGVYIPDMEKPKNITRCSYKINPEECKCIYTDKVFEETLALIMDYPCDDCPLIDIVTCGECVYYEESEYIEGDMVCKYHIGHTYYTEADRFCSYGERRSDESDT